MAYREDLTILREDYLVIDNALNTRSVAYVWAYQLDVPESGLVFLQYRVADGQFTGRFVKAKRQENGLVRLEPYDGTEYFDDLRFD